MWRPRLEDFRISEYPIVQEAQLEMFLETVEVSSECRMFRSSILC